ncbi:MAG: hypothetical protein CM1200mP13_10020 [Candidatus Pelagibacterales bacterium]|nr:MAG: hypothetical protein CM1200mP13_10020 [Pelagibacterales bacterium]
MAIAKWIFDGEPTVDMLGLNQGGMVTIVQKLT